MSNNQDLNLTNSILLIFQRQWLDANLISDISEAPFHMQHYPESLPTAARYLELTR